MSTDRIQLLSDLIARAAEARPDQRDAIIAEAARRDPDLAADASRLLQREADLGAFLEPPDAATIERILPCARMTAEAGRRIGPYRLIRPIGAGGMGSVYYAVRDDGAFDQEVAIKLLRSGLDAPHHIARFERERTLLARIAHPAVARIIDAGTAPGGLPYLVMEFIDGDPLDTHAATRRLTTSERVRLMLPICLAAHAAHQSLVIHGDIKPRNILVGRDGAPRLVDFGLAAELHSEADALPAAGLTPGFASPEQVAGQPVTTAGDIYALGRTLDAVLRAGDAPAPDADLRAIIDRASQTDPAQRYASAVELRDDLERWLARRPVLARGDDPVYRTVRFASRHRVALAIVAVACVAAASALVVAAQSLARERAARADATRAARDAERTVAFLQSVLGSTDPYAIAAAPAIADMIARASSRAAIELRDQPAVEAEVRRSLALSFAALWQWGDVAEQIERAVALDDQFNLWDDASRAAALALNSRALSHFRHASALPVAERALDLARAARPGDDPLVADALGCVAFAVWQTGDAESAARIEPLYLESLAMHERLALPANRDHARMAFSYAVFLMAQGRSADAEQRFLQALDIMRRAPQGADRYTVECLSIYAAMLSNLGRAAEAAALFDEAESLTPDTVNDHRAVTMRWDRASATIVAGHPERALQQALDALVHDIRFVAESRPALAATADRRRGAIEAALPTPTGADLAGALTLLVDAYASMEAPADPLRRCLLLGVILRRAGRPEDSLPLLEACAAIAAARHDLPPVLSEVIKVRLAQTLADLNEPDRAADLLESALAAEHFRSDHPLRADASALLARLRG